MGSAEAAERLKMARNSVILAAHKGAIKAYRVGRGRTSSLAFTPEDVEAYADVRRARGWNV